MDLTRPLSVAAFLAGLLSLWYLAPFAYRRSHERRFEQLCRAGRTIVLTSDDGPGAELTPRLLDLLRHHGVSATFFVLGRRAEDQPALVHRLSEEGHEIGSHTYDHLDAWKARPSRVARDVDRGIGVVAGHGGDASLFRPPYGKLTAAGFLKGQRRGLRYGWWTVDSRDSWERRPIADVIAELEARGGGVTLMHDYDRYNLEQDGVSHVDYVLALTGSIIELAQSRGYHLRTLDQLLTAGRTG
jgi:peptidoglycan/xylan/chitin deacetylase (PgdA/CDA1 family)